MNQYEEIEKRIETATSLEELVSVLETLFNRNFSVWRDGQLYNIKQLVAKVNGLHFEINSNEHAPPHFHVKGGDIDATFSIDSGELLQGKIDGRRKALVGWWYSRSRDKLITVWNQTRPSDCPVGPVKDGEYI